MGKKILIIQGHPDAGHGHLGDALVAAYSAAARKSGHEVDILTVAALKFPLLTSREDWEKNKPCADIQHAQERIAAAAHILLFYPLWLGSMPAMLKGFLEQVLRPGFAFGADGSDTKWKKKLKGKSARVVITMGMPALAYRWFYRAHGLKSLQRNILAFCGISPIGSTLIGMIESHKPDHQLKAIHKLEKLGLAGK